MLAINLANVGEATPHNVVRFNDKKSRIRQEAPSCTCHFSESSDIQHVDAWEAGIIRVQLPEQALSLRRDGLVGKLYRRAPCAR